MNPTNRKLFNLFYFFITIGILIVFLKVVNWLPMAFQKETMRRYSSVEEVRSRLNIRDVFIPSYFPQNLSWPPSEILAQGKPFTAVVMEFRDMEKGSPALIITQVSYGANFIPDKKIKIIQIKERVSYLLKGREAVLEAGFCKEDEPCSRISWNEGNYRISVVMKSTPHDLIKIVDSMIH